MFAHAEIELTIDAYGKAVGETPRMNGLVWSVHTRPVDVAADRLGTFALAVTTQTTRTSVASVSGLSGSADNDRWPRVDQHDTAGAATGAKTMVAVANERLKVSLTAATSEAGKKVNVMVAVYGMPVSPF